MRQSETLNDFEAAVLAALAQSPRKNRSRRRPGARVSTPSQPVFLHVSA